MQHGTTEPAASPRLRALGRAIRSARGDLTQAQLADRLGSNQTTVSRWEQGIVDLGVEHVRALEHALTLPVGDLLRAGGYASDDELPEPILQIDRYGNLETALSHIRAAAFFDFGVRVTNRWEISERPRERVLIWTVTTATEAPGDEIEIETA